MTIRFTCAECTSVLKIKDELAGTSGRCPKCKTEFVVPDAPSPAKSPDKEFVVSQAPLLSAADSESSEYLVSGGGLSSDDIPIDHQPAPRPPKLSEAQDSEIPSSPVLMETLRLDDGDGESDVIPSVSAKNEGRPVAPRVSPMSSDDDDLDSPPVMVSAVMPLSKSASASTGNKRNEKSSDSADRAAKNPKPAPTETEVEPFDPLQFLMADRPVGNRGYLPSNARGDTPDLSLSDYSLSDDSLSDDSDDDVRDRPTPDPLSRPTPAIASARSTPEKMDLATAAKMMKKAIKDSQAEVAQQRERDARSGFDYGQIFREFGLRGLAVLVGGFVLTFGLYVAANRVFGSSLRLPKLGYVTGTLKLDGQPLSGAMVYFAPMEVEMAGTKRERARTSVGVTDDRGYFKMMYANADRIEGVAAGRCRVWVTHLGEKGNDIPPDWMEGAMKIEEVKEGSQKGPFDFSMESKKR